MRARSLLVGVVLALAVPAATAHAGAPVDLSGRTGGSPALAADPSSGRTLALWGRPGPDGFGNVSLSLSARVLSAGGRPIDTPRQIAVGLKPALFVPGTVAVAAADPRRGRFLVAYAAHRPGMARAPCPVIPAAGPPLPAGPIVCAITDTEIFVRLLDRRGRPLGPERQVSSVGPAERADTAGTAPVIAFDERSGSYLIVYAGTVDSAGDRAALYARRLSGAGVPEGEAVPLGPQPGAVAQSPYTRLAGDPRGGFLLAYLWGQSATDRALLTQRLGADGRPTTTTQTLPTPGGAGAGSVEMAFDRRKRRALVITSTSAPGSSGFQAQQLRADGQPATPPVRLPDGGGNGPVLAAAHPRAAGWVYTFARSARRLARRVYVQRASAGGRTIGRRRLVTPAGARASEPQLATTSRGGVVVAWSEEAINCRGSACTGTQRLRTYARVVTP